MLSFWRNQFIILCLRTSLQHSIRHQLQTRSSELLLSHCRSVVNCWPVWQNMEAAHRINRATWKWCLHWRSVVERRTILLCINLTFTWGKTDLPFYQPYPSGGLRNMSGRYMATSGSLSPLHCRNACQTLSENDLVPSGTKFSWTPLCSKLL